MPARGDRDPQGDPQGDHQPPPSPAVTHTRGYFTADIICKAKKKFKLFQCSRGNVNVVGNKLWHNTQLLPSRRRRSPRRQAMCIAAASKTFSLVCGRSFREPERINFLLHCPYKQNFSSRERNFPSSSEHSKIKCFFLYCPIFFGFLFM